MAHGSSFDKAALHEQLLAQLGKQRDKLSAAQRLSAEGLTHEDARAEGDKDMRATEASYVARGQAMRVEQLAEDHDRVHGMKLRVFGAADPVALGAIVTLATDEGERVVFLAPAGGGLRVSAGGREVQVVTPSSPLGKSLLGARTGDDVGFTLGGREQEASVLSVE